MGTKIIDLSDVLSPDKQVRFTPDGPLYKVPGDIPVELYLRITSLQGAEDGIDHDMVKVLHSELLELFRSCDPDISELPATLPQLVLAIPRIYGPEADEPDESGPTTRRTPGGSSKRSPRSSRSRS